MSRRRKKRKHFKPKKKPQPKKETAIMSTTSGERKTLTILKNLPGVMDCELKHQFLVEETRADLTFHVPFPQDEWNRILAFFKWGYDTYKSEQHVRLFVNAEQKTWKAWAFPQNARIGMAVNEIEDHPNFAPQRLQFPGPDWLFFGTVHHHCSGSAFQSFTDRNDEETKDGFHITIGDLNNAEAYSIDYRFYISGLKFDKKVTWFWDVGDARDHMPKWLRKMISDDAIAKEQMGVPAPAGTEFPQEWKDNVIAPPPPPQQQHTQHNGRHTGWGESRSLFDDAANGYCEGKPPYLEKCYKVYEGDCRRFISDLGNYMKRRNDAYEADCKKQGKEMNPEHLMMREHVLDMLLELACNEELDDDMMNIFGFCVRHDLKPISIYDFWSKLITPPTGGVIKFDEDDKLKGTRCELCGLMHPYHEMHCPETTSKSSVGA